MGRYVKKLGTRRFVNYDQKFMERAIQACQKGKISIRQASLEYAVPYCTLNDRLKGKHTKSYGGQTVLSHAEEKRLTDALHLCADWGFPLKRRDVLKVVQSYLNAKGTKSRFKDNKPGVDWFRAFMSRNKNLSERLLQNVKRCRASVSKEILEEYFKNLEKSLDGVPPQNIINYDETNFTDDPGSSKALVKRGVKHAEDIKDTSKTSISVMMAASAAGVLLPPFTVYKSTHLYPTWVEGGIAGAAYNRNSSGWFDLEMFEEWFDKVLLPYVKKLGNGPFVIIGDNLSSHVSLSVVKKCEDNNIRFVLLPPNSTHICQPLDVSFFHPLKTHWRRILSEWKNKHSGVLPKSEFPRLLKLTIDAIGMKQESNITAGFSSCGIHPFNPNHVFKKVKSLEKSADIEADDPELVSAKWSEALVNHLRETRKNAVTPSNKPRGKRLNISPGETVVSRALDPDYDPEQDSEEVDNPSSPIEVSSHSTEDQPSSIEDPPSSIEDPPPSNKDQLPTNPENPVVPSTSTQLEQEFKEEDFVIVKFPTDKRTRFFIGRITKVLKKKFKISFLRKKTSLKSISYVYPNVKDISIIENSNIIKKVSGFLRGRGHYHFNVNHKDME